jgi:hypothetical protein
MKLIARVFALSLVVTGAFATSTLRNTPASAATASTARVSALPIPSCPPDGTNDCGMTRH